MPQAVTVRITIWECVTLDTVLKIIMQRLALGLVTLLIVSVVIFVAVNMLPGDFAQAILGQGATEESVAAIRRDLGLDQPMVTRYFSWLGGVVQGDPCPRHTHRVQDADHPQSVAVEEGDRAGLNDQRLSGPELEAHTVHGAHPPPPAAGDVAEQETQA